MNRGIDMSTRTEDRDFERSQNAADRRDETRANNLPTRCAGCGKWRVQPECRELYIREINERDGECKCNTAVGEKAAQAA